jgi:Tfp pilus assembly protein PilN
MLAEEAAGRPQQIDFLHPRQRPKPQDRRRLYAIAGGAAGALAVAVVLLLWMQLSGQSAAALRLQQEISQQDKLAKAGKIYRDRAAKLERFEKGDVSWLDELRVLSLKAPPPEKTRVEDLNAIVDPSGGGAITINALSSNRELPHEFGQSLRESGRVVNTSGAAKDPKLSGPHSWKHSVKIVAIPIVDRAAQNNAASPSNAAAKGQSRPRKAPPAKGGKR